MDLDATHGIKQRKAMTRKGKKFLMIKQKKEFYDKKLYFRCEKIRH